MQEDIKLTSAAEPVTDLKIKQNTANVNQRYTMYGLQWKVDAVTVKTQVTSTTEREA